LSANEALKRGKAVENEDDGISKKQKVDKNVSDDKAKIREMNRAAQLRCRKRKQIKWKKMEEELKLLKNENTKLIQENQNFKHKFYALKELLVQHKSVGAAENSPFLVQIEEILNASVPIVKKASGNLLPTGRHKAIKNKIPITPPIVPVPMIQNAGQTVQKPVLIQVMGSVAQLAVSVLPNK
jgi:hypothetical protein